MSALRAIAKRVAVQTVARTAPLTWRWRSTASLLILMYHRVLPKDSVARSVEQPGMYVSPETLDLHLRELKERFELVHLDDWLHRAAADLPLPRLGCAITFDDGWRDNHDFGLPVLARHEAPATIFLVSSLIGSRYRFWPNRLMALLQKSFAAPGSVIYPQPLDRLVAPLLALAGARGALDFEEVDRAVESAKALDEQEIRHLVEEAEASCAATADSADILNAEELGRMAATGLIRYGSHTATHLRLGGRIRSGDLESEIVGSQKRLQEVCGQPIDIFCYPNGETSPAAIDLVRRHYIGAVTTSKGWHRPGANPYLIRRLGMHEDASDTRDAFLARLSGWL